MRRTLVLALLLLAGCSSPAPRTVAPSTAPARQVDCLLRDGVGTVLGRLRGPEAGPWTVEVDGLEGTLDAAGVLDLGDGATVRLGPVVGAPC